MLPARYDDDDDIYKESVLNIADRANVDLGLDNVDTL